MGSYLSINRWSSNKAEQVEAINGEDINGEQNGHEENNIIDDDDDEIVKKSSVKLKDCSVLLDNKHIKPINIDGDQKISSSTEDHVITYDEVVSSYEKAHLITNETGIDSTEATFGTMNESEANLTIENGNENDIDNESNLKDEDMVELADQLTDKIRDTYNKVKESKHNYNNDELPVARKSKPIILVEDKEPDTEEKPRHYCVFEGCNKSYKTIYNLRNHVAKFHDSNHGGQKRIRELLETESTGSYSDSAESKSDVSSLSDYQASPKKPRKEKNNKRKKKL